MYRSRRELSNELPIAKFSVDTAENEASKVWPALLNPAPDPPGSKKQPCVLIVHGLLGDDARLIHGLRVDRAQANLRSFSKNHDSRG